MCNLPLTIASLVLLALFHLVTGSAGSTKETHLTAICGVPRDV